MKIRVGNLRTYWVLIALMFGIHCYTYAGDEKVNILHPFVYGFESGGDGWSMQHSDYWGLTDQKSSDGTYSIKYSHDATITDGSKKAQSSDLTDYQVNLTAGTYTMTLKVWIESGTQLTAFKTTFKKPTWVNVKWDIVGAARGEWVELTKEVTFPEDINGTSMLLTMEQSYGGIGTIYIDEIAIETVEIDYVSSINTIGSGNLSLDAGTYNVKTNVYVESGTTINKFYTFISNPWVAIEWDLSSANKDEWVELNQEVIIPSKVENSEFKIQVNNNPNYGGGVGSFFIDDLSFTFESDDATSIMSETFDYHIYPNPANDFIRVKTEKLCTYVLYNLTANAFKASNTVSDDFTINVSDLPTGLYLLQLKSENQRVARKIRIN